MRTMSSVAGVLAVVAVVVVVVPPARAQTCVGDCDNIGVVLVNDLIRGVNIVLGLELASTCPAFENSDGQVDMAQLIKAVNNALSGCPSGPTPTASETTTATGTATATATPTTVAPTHTATNTTTATATATALATATAWR